MAITKGKRKAPENVQTQNEIWDSLGLDDDDLLDFHAPIKQSRHEEQLMKSVDRVEGKLDSFEERLVKLEEENRLTESLLNSLLAVDAPTSSVNYEETSNYYCNYCNLALSTGKLLCSHMYDRHVVSQKKLLHCSVCKFGCEEIIDIQQHLNSHCADGSCYQCSFDQKSGIKAHSIEKVVRMKLVCDFCPYTDTNISSYQVHCLVCTNNPTNDNYQPTNEGRVCPTCSQVFNSNAYLLKHISQRHSGNNEDRGNSKNFICEDCGRYFISSASLGGHRKVHKKQPGVLKVEALTSIDINKKPAKKRRSAFPEVQPKAAVECKIAPSFDIVKGSQTFNDVVVEDMPSF